MQVHVFDVVGIPCMWDASHICTSWESLLEFDDIGTERQVDSDDSSAPPTDGWQLPQPWCWMALEVTEGQPRHFLHTRPSL